MPRAKRQHLKKQKDGRYYCRYHGKTFSGATEDEAFDKREEYKRLEAAHEAARRDPLVEEYVAEWLPLYKRGVSEKCYADYAKQLDALTAVVGGLRVREVGTTDARRVYAHFAGYSQSTIHRARMLYVAVFDTAVEDGICPRNPFRSKYAQPDKGTAGTHRVITDEERQLIHNTPHRMRLAALVMLYAGLRRGEALAIQIEKDVDLKAGVIHVRQAVRFRGNAPVITATKTASGVRDVPIFPPLADELKNQSGWLIASAKGLQATETAFSRAWDSYLHALSVAAGHPVVIRCHDLRHSYCTMLRDAGVDMKQAMLWMGHADEKMILRVYDHVTETRTRESVQKVVKRLRNGLRTNEKSAETIAAQ